MVTSKCYVSYTPNNTYIQANGKSHIFFRVDSHGELNTSDEALQKELDDAIDSGAPFTVKELGISPTAKLALQKLALQKLAEASEAGRNLRSCEVS